MELLQMLSAIIVGAGLVAFARGLAWQRVPKSAINILRLSGRITAMILVLSGLASVQAFAADSDSGYRIIQQLAQKNPDTITSGVYGPFSSYYFPSLAVRDGACHLLNDDFVVICFPGKTTVGQLLAETDTAETIQAQIFAVNNGVSERPMPEIVVNIPLADMDQTFFTKDVVKRLFRVNSIFDEPCKLRYQIDRQSPNDEEWLCSSFLQHFDKHTGQPGLYYELRIRPLALRLASDKKTVVNVEQDWFDFFKKLQHGNRLISRVDLLDNDLTVDFALDLTGYAGWMRRLIDVYYIDTPTIDTSAYNEWAEQISNLYSAQDKPESQEATDIARVGEKLYGPFDPRVCQVKRYIEHTNNTNNQSLYPDMFLINCDHLRVYETNPPAWSIQIFTQKKDSKDSALIPASEDDDISVTFRLQGHGAYGSVSINTTYIFPLAYASLNYPLEKMPQDFFNSQVLQSTLRSPGRLERPCTVSYIADGNQINKERFECDLSYKTTGDTINFVINVDYGFQKCIRRVDKPCQKDTLMKAASFLKEINQNTKNLTMAIEFAGGEAISADLDLATFDSAAVDRLFKRIESLD